MNRLHISILLFMIVMYSLYSLRPSFMFYPNGALRDFGIGRKQKTILPLWLIAILTAILSFVASMYGSLFLQYR
jgi:hypothetical protein